MVNFLSGNYYTYYNPWEYNGNGNGNDNDNGDDNNSVTNNPNGNNNNNNNNNSVNDNSNNSGNNDSINGNNNSSNGVTNPSNGNNNNNNGAVNNDDTSPTIFSPDKNSLNLVDKFYDSTYCWGTKDEQMENVLNSINSDNVLDVMRAWNLVHSTEKGESFMKAFMWDATHGQKEKYGKQIELALRDRAIAAGVFEDCREDFAVIDNELRSWLYISNDISANYDNIVNKLVEAEEGTNGTPYNQSSKTTAWRSAFRGTLA